MSIRIASTGRSVRCPMVGVAFDSALEAPAGEDLAARKVGGLLLLANEDISNLKFLSGIVVLQSDTQSLLKSSHAFQTAKSTMYPNK